MTSRSTLGSWIEGRRPPVPEAFRPHLSPGDSDAPATAAAWVGEARRALSRMDADPAAREAAFELLAADAYATWACEAALEAEDPGAALRGVLDALME